MAVIRDMIHAKDIAEALEEVRQKVNFRLAQKGWGAYAGPHEAYGIIAEEFNKELLDALHANDAVQFRKELLDTAVACVLAMASLLPPDTNRILKATEPALHGCTRGLNLACEVCCASECKERRP